MFAIYLTGTVILVIIIVAITVIYLSQRIEHSISDFSKKFIQASNISVIDMLAEQKKQNHILIDIRNMVEKNNLPNIAQNSPPIQGQDTQSHDALIEFNQAG